MNPTDKLAFYASHSVMSDPGAYAARLDGLPADLPALTCIVQGLLLHPRAASLYEVELSSIQRKEINIRPMAELLRLLTSLDERPLHAARLPQERVAGNSRDHALLLCTLLRHQGRPARVRTGFASYFGSRLIVEHWLCEAWEPDWQRWRLVDALLDAAQWQANQAAFDPCDVPLSEFYLSGRAWQMCRAGEAKSGSFGLNSKHHGWPSLRQMLVQDLAALNKIEVLPHDSWWELTLKPEEALTADDRSQLDRIAGLTQAAGEQFAELRQAFEDDSQFSGPVTSRLRLLGLLGNGKAAGAGLILRPADSSRLQALAGAQAAPAEAPGVVFYKSGAPAPGLDPTQIVVRGAQQHNLKHVDVTIPRYKLVVLTGVSGSGKSSLAFDTLYAEGQRRYVESLSTYVRRYLDQMDKPKVDYIAGLSPAIAIEQKSISKNPRSTVGTVTEVIDYLRVLFSRAGVQHCPQCGRVVEPLSAQPIAERLLALPPGTRFQILSPLVRDRKGSHADLLDKARQQGFTRARVDGQMVDLLDAARPALRKTEKHTLEVVVDRLAAPPADLLDEEKRDYQVRLIDSVETGLRAGNGMLLIDLGSGDEVFLSEHNACPHCELTLPRLTASLFSFNAPAGMCPECNGLGTKLEVDPDLIVEHPELSLLDGASRWYGNLRKKKGGRHWLGNLQTMADHYGVDLDLPWKDLPEKFREVLLYGSGEEKIKFVFDNENEENSWRGENVRAVKGIVYHVNRLFRQTKSDYTRRFYVSFLSHQPCPDCGGARLCAEARYVTVGGKTFSEVNAMTIETLLAWVEALMGLGAPAAALPAGQLEVIGEVLKEIQSRLQFMLNVGLDYLSLDRPAPSLSGGEGQRIRLASQLGCGLVGVLYILDEPSIGLHARDQRSLLETLRHLRDMGNTVLVVEHDAETMRAADWLIDLGPGAGVLGGEIVAAGTPADVAANPHSLTGAYLSGAKQVSAPNAGQRRVPRGWLTLRGARLFNLKSIEARFPLGVFTCVTGVSGSGKSSLVADTLYPILTRSLHNAQATPGPYDALEGLDALDKVINITQDPIGRTPRSNPVTYVGVYDAIRQVFAATPEAKMRGYQAARFSFNVKGGRCEACLGHGQKKIEMHFLPDVWVACQECKGMRYNRQTLEIQYKGKNIAEVLDMDVQDALVFFARHPAIARSLQTLHDVGLDYVKLGQSATTLSGGEAQRVKLAKELSRIATGRTIYILDEPTTGLHFADIQRLLDVLHRLVDAGNTVLVIEHNLDVIKTADWIMDLGPEGGQAGGYIIAEGTPEEVAQSPVSFTGRFLAKEEAHG